MRKNTLIRRLCLLFLCAGLSASPIPALAQNTGEAPSEMASASDPVATVKRLYGLETGNAGAGLPMTQRLERLFLLDELHLEESGEPIGRLDFDWVVNGQDALITDVKVTSFSVPLRDFGDEAVDQFERMIVTAEFKNFDSQMRLRYYWIRERSGWKLDDVASVGEFPWTLSLLLAYGG